MTLLVAVVGTVGLGAVIFILVIMARLTQRWEEVTRSRSHYRLFYVSAVLVGTASLVRLIRAGYLISDTGPVVFSEPQSWFYVLLYHAPLTIGMSISLAVTWRNWEWLLTAKEK